MVTLSLLLGETDYLLLPTRPLKLAAFRTLLVARDVGLRERLAIPDCSQTRWCAVRADRPVKSVAVPEPSEASARTGGERGGKETARTEALNVRARDDPFPCVQKARSAS